MKQEIGNSSGAGAHAETGESVARGSGLGKCRLRLGKCRPLEAGSKGPSAGGAVERCYSHLFTMTTLSNKSDALSVMDGSKSNRRLKDFSASGEFTDSRKRPFRKDLELLRS